MTKQLKSDLMLLLVALFWGISYVLMDLSLKEMDPFTLNAFRFCGAFFIAVIFSFPKLKTVNRITIKYSFYVGAALIFAYTGATYGVLYTSLSNAGFLCALSVVFTPIFGFVFKGTVPEKKLIIVVLMCVIGIGLLTLNSELKPALGDILCLICAVAYAFDLLITETAVVKEEVNAYQLGVFQLGFAGAGNLILSFIVETPTLPQSPKVWASTIFLAIFCTGLAFIVQAVAQQYTSATHVGVIFTLEPVIAGIAAFVFAGEVLLPRAYLGAIILVLSLLVMEMNMKGIFNIIKRKNN
ncbi:MAG: DMT family transporter [Peptostreptococcaceae bacterium]|nr:DMT family transporter [Peptostreptococcaceae bacterium]